MKLDDTQVSFIEKRLEATHTTTDLDLYSEITEEQLEALRQEIYGFKKPWHGVELEFRTKDTMLALIFMLATDTVFYRDYEEQCLWATVITKNQEHRANFNDAMAGLDKRENIAVELARILGIDLYELNTEVDEAYRHMDPEHKTRNQSWDVDGMNAYLRRIGKAPTDQ
ncbi:hypothetical protein phi16_gp025 [Corynebacterium phage phi16]|uniref:hypothetical protein n=1 Tax=Corynebacterium glutamicum TaxID=1718 RepID=UPI000944E3A0|nr:hypothetical protein [Corynebacterium glutamicum]APQ42529.1 hypothetical protein phi16_gp025 [Corynebacterium phage phi16]OKX80477.1 hypothetical protein AUO95_09985 [Corynebacterium glutamicum]